MHYVYLLESLSRKTTYIGSTTDLRRRLREHNDGVELSTKRYLPWHLVAYEAYQSEKDAREREQKLKHHGNAVREFKRRAKNSFKNGAGFTLVEVLIVLALIGVIVAVGIVAGLDTIARSTAAGERDLLVSLLLTARTEALANINESAHGVHIDTDNFVIFEGDVFDDSDESNRPVRRSAGVSVTGGPDVIFEQLSANLTDGEVTITLSDGASNADIVINSIGQIEW